MEGQPILAADRHGQLEATILRRVSEQAELWFPEVGAAPAVRLRRLAERPLALLYAVHVGDGPAPRVLAKVRLDRPDSTGSAPGAVRPRLTSHFATAAELTALEFSGLTAIREMVDGTDPAFAAVRPLDQLAGDSTILMEYVAASTLRDRAVRGNRFSLHRRGGRLADDVWRNSGSWLRRYQRWMPGDGVPGRQGHRDDVVALFAAFGEFLERRFGARVVGDAARRGAELAAAVLPENLPLAVGHGDFAPRNVFLQNDGRLAVFDPMPRWQVPRFEDLCRFLVNLRLQAVTLLTHGWADGARELDRRERLLIEGYRDDEVLPMAQLRCYQLLITLDKWSTLVPGGQGGPSARIRAASTVVSSSYLRAETHRLLALAETEG